MSALSDVAFCMPPQDRVKRRQEPLMFPSWAHPVNYRMFRDVLTRAELFGPSLRLNIIGEPWTLKTAKVFARTMASRVPSVDIY